ncbi:MAG: hypothetical protein ISP01_05370 [Methanobrevibacter arboriphilus]|uniref:Uncharacterized protein n=1 Tax=Methanobrevibacter arboriphilus TaxID=39441 RepID=A0A843AMS5_METAZ|nr:hypothetical protein [Methanobrevibacter arboriphilus]MBF4468818.1 hypothetical protein [Methanobrevibacter arboriphilus]
MIDDLLDLNIKQLRGIYQSNTAKPGNKTWYIKITYQKRVYSFLGLFHDPWTTCMIYSIIKKELTGKNPIQERNINYCQGYYQVRKYLNGRICWFGSYRKIEHARAERDILESVGWDLDLACEGVDETINGWIMFNNKVVG